MKIFTRETKNCDYLLLSQAVYSVSNSSAPSQFLGGEINPPEGYREHSQQIAFLVEPDWRLVRRRIEEHLRKNSDARELWAIATVLGIKLQ